MDATGSHFMDFSDFYVLPSSPLPPAWSMSEEALRRGLAEQVTGMTVELVSGEIGRAKFSVRSDIYMKYYDIIVGLI